MDLFPGLHKGNSTWSCTSSCSTMEPFLGSDTIKTALCLPFLWGYLTFYPCVRGPWAVSHLLLEYPTHNLHFVTRHVNRGAPVWFMERLFSVELTCELQLKQCIPLSHSSLQPNKLQESWVSLRWISDRAILIWKEEKSDCDITGSFEGGDWIYQTVQKGITNLSDLQVLPATLKYERTRTCLCTLCTFSGGVQMKSDAKVAVAEAEIGCWHNPCDNGQKKSRLYRVSLLTENL